MWSLITAPDELERCCVVLGDDHGGRRCWARTAFQIAAEEGALDDYAFVCEHHVDLVAGSGYVVMAVERR